MKNPKGNEINRWGGVCRRSIMSQQCFNVSDFRHLSEQSGHGDKNENSRETNTRIDENDKNASYKS